MSPPQPSGTLRAVTGLGRAAIVLIWLLVAVDLAFYLVARNAQEAMLGYQSGELGVASLARADQVIAATGFIGIALLLAAALVFLLWLWRARVNSELLCQAQHVRSRGWVWGAWICPVVNLWFPFQIVRDTWKASHPDAAPEGYNMHRMPFTKVLGWWWLFFLLDNVVDYFIIVTEAGEVSAESLGTIANAEAVSTLVSAVAAILITRLILQISRWQEPRLAGAEANRLTSS